MIKPSNINNHRIVFFILFLGFISYGQDLKVKINKNISYQTIEGFGASDAWRFQFVGKNWPIKKKEKIAEWLFSKKVDKKGTPKGIGLSIWRFYLGAGTTEQGKNSNIKNEWRRSESFLSPNGKYDWNKQEGQQWFLKKAKKYGVDKFIAFSISAPVQWTKNGKGYNGNNKDGEINLKANHFDDFAQFMVNFLKHFKSKGIAFDYLSPINEPQWDWEKKSQEGTPATNKNIIKIAKLLNDKIEHNNLSTKIVLGESADLRWLYSDFGKPKRGSQIDYFFNQQNKIKNVKNTISGHSYFTTWPIDSLISIRQKLNDKIKSKNLNYWQSEFCILENNSDIGGGHNRDLGMNTALYVARVIHADLTLANASSWQWWTALTNANYKDGLIYLDTGDKNDLYNLNHLKSDGYFHDSKLLWAFGNFSRFIRPKMKRVKIETNQHKSVKETYKDIMISAYLDKKTSKLVVVVINHSNKNRVIDFSDYQIVSIYETSKNKNLEHRSITNKRINFKARSVNTLIGSVL